MPSVETAPSLLSRLSPTPFSSSPSTHNQQHNGSHEVPPHLRDASSPPLQPRDFPASLPNHSHFAASTSPRSFGASPPSPYSPGFGPTSGHRPIPVHRTSRPNSRYGAGSSHSPSNVLSSSYGRSPPVAMNGARPISGGLSISPSTSFTKGPGSPSSVSSARALDQIEAMLEQIRAQSSSPPTSAASPRRPSVPLPRSPLVGPTSLARLPSVGSIERQSSFTRSSPAVPAKKPVLGGKSKWARDGDAEADDFSSAAEKEAANGTMQKEAEAEVASLPPAVPVVDSAPVTDLPAATLSPAPANVADVLPSDPSPPLPKFTASHHIDWADDDDDDTLPTLDDWGVDVEHLPFEADPEPAFIAPPPPPQAPSHHHQQPSISRTSSHSHALPSFNRAARPAPPHQQAQQAPRAPPHNPWQRQQRAPPPHLAAAAAAASAATSAPPAAPSPVPPAPEPVSKAALPKPTNRIFASARAAVVLSSPPPTSTSPPSSDTKTLPALDSVVSPPAPPAKPAWSAGPPPSAVPAKDAQQPPTAPAAQRKPMGPPGALFSRLSGLSASRPGGAPSPPLANGNGGGGNWRDSAPVNGPAGAGAPAAGGGKRSKRGGKKPHPHAPHAHAHNGPSAPPTPAQPPPLPPAPVVKAPAPPPATPAWGGAGAGRGGGGTQTSKWA